MLAKSVRELLKSEDDLEVNPVNIRSNDHVSCIYPYHLLVLYEYVCKRAIIFLLGSVACRKLWSAIRQRFCVGALVSGPAYTTARIGCRGASYGPEMIIVGVEILV